MKNGIRDNDTGEVIEGGEEVLINNRGKEPIEK